jgi:GNAT superfamily N-acetyltransferase
MIKIGLVKYKAAEAQLLDLFRISFGYDMPLELWNWKHCKYYINSGEPEVVVATDNDRIIGARPFLFVEMWLGNKRVFAAQHCDTMVHPEYRSQGIFNQMGQYSIQYLKENGCALSYGFPGPMSRAGFLKQGWKIVGPRESIFQITRPRDVFSLKLKSSLIGVLAGSLYQVFSGVKTGEFAALSPSFHVSLSDHFIKGLEEVDSLRDKKTIDLFRSENFLRWRFDSHPSYRYKYVIASREGKLYGYAVIRVLREGAGLTKGMIVDYLIKNYDKVCFQVLLHSCLKEFEKSGCHIIYLWMLNEFNPLRELFKSSGFKSSFRFPYKRFYRYEYLDVISIQEPAAGDIDIYDKENWRVSGAFHDSN